MSVVLDGYDAVVLFVTLPTGGPVSVVGIATAYWLDGPGIESR